MIDYEIIIHKSIARAERESRQERKREVNHLFAAPGVTSTSTSHSENDSLQNNIS